MAKLIDKLMNRVIKGKLIVEQGDELGDVQEKLISGSNIKTINGSSILGEGDLEIKGGTQLYRHQVNFSQGAPSIIDIISTDSEPYSETHPVAPGDILSVKGGSGNYGKVVYIQAYYGNVTVFGVLSIDTTNNVFTYSSLQTDNIVNDSVNAL